MCCYYVLYFEADINDYTTLLVVVFNGGKLVEEDA